MRVTGTPLITLTPPEKVLAPARARAPVPTFTIEPLPLIALLLVVFAFFVSAVFALSVYTAAFVCEAVRSGVNSVSVGQAEAARSIGLTFNQTLREVVMPQAFRTIVPPLINIFIALTKNTSVAGGFFVLELFGVGRRLANAYSGDVIAVLLGVAFFYLLITIPSGLLANQVERKVAFAR